ncbi:hypothetical protein GGH95_003007 [Coemansia sp. RSA 1836]|nr:hypothetical protein GGH95_003007 [Coemansia sp. RSA 1836]
MQYYIEDAKKQKPYLGVVKLDLAQSVATGAWDYNYIVVDLYSKDQSNAGLPSSSLSSSSSVSQQSVGRVKVLVTDEFAKQVKDFETERRNHRFTPKKHNEEGSWISVLNPANWRK